MLTNEEFAIVRRLAEGDGSYRSAAEQVFKNRLADHVAAGRKDSAMNFLSETFNKTPDHTLRSKYRAQVLANN
jgi:hypothetical protein